MYGPGGSSGNWNMESESLTVIHGDVIQIKAITPFKGNIWWVGKCLVHKRFRKDCELDNVLGLCTCSVPNPRGEVGWKGLDYARFLTTKTL